MTSRGQFNDEMTRAEYEEETRKDVLNQQSGATFDPLTLVDIRFDHTPAFFDTMLARAYVGYGASSLGFATTEQPGQHFGQSGTAKFNNDKRSSITWCNDESLCYCKLV